MWLEYREEMADELGSLGVVIDGRKPRILNLNR
jgi:hypothetical protein